MDVPAQPGPALREEIFEVQGVFPDDASLPRANPPAGEATPDMGANPLNTPVDKQQMRTLGASTAAAVGAIAAAGITVATGGIAAVAAGAALAAGAAAGGLTAVVTGASDRADTDQNNRTGAAGLLVLSARATDAAKQAAAESAMRAAGASRVEPVHRINAGLGA
jgi:hypothetical protein